MIEFVGGGGGGGERLLSTTQNLMKCVCVCVCVLYSKKNVYQNVYQT